MGRENPAEKALYLLRRRLCDPSFIFKPFSDSPDSKYSKLKSILSSSITEACNNSILLLGPRGSGKIAIKLSGLLHSDDNWAFKVSFDDNLQFMIAMLRECVLAHQTIIFVLDECDLFAQGKQRLLYSLLDAMQSVSSQAVVIGVSCRLSILADEKFKDVNNTYINTDSTVNYLLKFLFRTVSNMDLAAGFLSLENFKSALSNVQRQPKLESIKDCSILELYILVSLKRLAIKEQNSYNFNSVMKAEYKSVHDSFQTSDYYAQNVCLRAFEHLLQCELISFTDSRGNSQSIEFRPVKLLVSSHELHQGLKSYRSCPFSYLPKYVFKSMAAKIIIFIPRPPK